MVKFSMGDKLFLVPEAPVALSWQWQGGHPISALWFCEPNLLQAGKGSALSLSALKHQHDSAAAAPSEILVCVCLFQAGKIFVSFIVFETDKKGGLVWFGVFSLQNRATKGHVNFGNGPDMNWFDQRETWSSLV